MGNTYTSPDELRYYRNLLAFEVGDEVEWNLNQKNPSSPRMRGKITAIYPEGKGAFTGMHNAFMTVYASIPSGLSYSVSLTNPTITKLETDK